MPAVLCGISRNAGFPRRRPSSAPAAPGARDLGDAYGSFRRGGAGVVGWLGGGGRVFFFFFGGYSEGC